MEDTKSTIALQGMIYMVLAYHRPETTEDFFSLGMLIAAHAKRARDPIHALTAVHDGMMHGMHDNSVTAKDPYANLNKADASVADFMRNLGIKK